MLPLPPISGVSDRLPHHQGEEVEEDNQREQSRDYESGKTPNTEFRDKRVGNKPDSNRATENEGLPNRKAPRSGALILTRNHRMNLKSAFH